MADLLDDSDDFSAPAGAAADLEASAGAAEGFCTPAAGPPWWVLILLNMSERSFARCMVFWLAAWTACFPRIRLMSLLPIWVRLVKKWAKIPSIVTSLPSVSFVEACLLVYGA